MPLPSSLRNLIFTFSPISELQRWGDNLGFKHEKLFDRDNCRQILQLRYRLENSELAAYYDFLVDETGTMVTPDNQFVTVLTATEIKNGKVSNTNRMVQLLTTIQALTKISGFFGEIGADSDFFFNRDITFVLLIQNYLAVRVEEDVNLTEIEAVLAGTKAPYTVALFYLKEIWLSLINTYMFYEPIEAALVRDVIVADAFELFALLLSKLYYHYTIWHLNPSDRIVQIYMKKLKDEKIVDFYPATGGLNGRNRETILYDCLSRYDLDSLIKVKKILSEIDITSGVIPARIISKKMIDDAPKLREFVLREVEESPLRENYLLQIAILLNEKVQLPEEADQFYEEWDSPSQLACAVGHFQYPEMKMIYGGDIPDQLMVSDVVYNPAAFLWQSQENRDINLVNAFRLGRQLEVFADAKTERSNLLYLRNHNMLISDTLDQLILRSYNEVISSITSEVTIRKLIAMNRRFVFDEFDPDYSNNLNLKNYRVWAKLVKRNQRSQPLSTNKNYASNRENFYIDDPDLKELKQILKAKGKDYQKDLAKFITFVQK